MAYWALIAKPDVEVELPTDNGVAVADASQGVLLLPVAPTHDVPGTPDDLLTNSEDDDDKKAEISANSITVAGEVLDEPAAPMTAGDDAPLSTVVRTEVIVKKKEVSDAMRQKLEVKVQSVLRLRHRVVECFRTNQVDKYQPLLRQLQELKVSRLVLARTGIGYLVSKPKDWPGRLQPLVTALKQSWERVAKDNDAIHGHGRLTILPLDKLPFRGDSAKLFMQKVALLGSWMKTMDKELNSDEIYKEGAMTMVMTGLDDPKALDGLCPEDAGDFHSSPTVRAMLARCFDVATAQGRARRVKMSAVRREQEKENCAGVSAKVVANQVEYMASAQALEQVNIDFVKLGVDTLAEKRRPRAVIQRLATAKLNHGDAVVEQLEKRQKTVMAQNVAGSNKSAASGLTCWYWFATQILDYPEDSTLPPSSDTDVMLYAGIFTCSGTAANYVGHLRLGCAMEHLPTSWDTSNLRKMMKGVRKTALRLFGGPARTKYLLVELRVQQLVAFNIGRGTCEIAWACLHAWEFCLRFQSEGLEVYAGEVDDLVILPPGRPNGLFIDKKGELKFVMRKRKHRPNGSVLTRTCRCREVKVCWVCAATKLLSTMVPGQLLWSLKSTVMLQAIRSQLDVLGEGRGASLLTWKSWRAGKATQLARDGHGLGSILNAGEWSREGRSWDRYCNVDAVNPGAVLGAVLDASENED